jgi:hypothetical protein
MNKVTLDSIWGRVVFNKQPQSGWRPVTNRSFPTSAANLRSAFANLHGETHVHLEAGELAPWAVAIIAPLVKRLERPL